jgi:hypothetical protein
MKLRETEKGYLRSTLWKELFSRITANSLERFEVVAWTYSIWRSSHHIIMHSPTYPPPKILNYCIPSFDDSKHIARRGSKKGTTIFSLDLQMCRAMMGFLAYYSHAGHERTKSWKFRVVVWWWRSPQCLTLRQLNECQCRRRRASHKFSSLEFNR